MFMIGQFIACFMILLLLLWIFQQLTAMLLILLFLKDL